MKFLPLDYLPSLATQANTLVSMGLAVLPLPPRRKIPPPTGWQDDIARYRDPAYIRWYWQRNPAANIGLPMAANNLLAADLDVHGHSGKPCPADCTSNGIDWLHAQVEAYPYDWLAGTIVQRTGSGGLQCVWATSTYSGTRLPDDVTGGAGKIARHVDLIIGNRYLAFAPSVHPNSNIYTPAENHRPLDFLTEVGGLDHAQIACPDWFFMMLLDTRPAPLVQPVEVSAQPLTIGPIEARWQARRTDKRQVARVEATIEGAINDLVTSPPKTRNDTLHEKAVYLAAIAADAGYTQSQIERELEYGWARLGKETGEGRATIASGLRYGFAHPHALPPLEANK